MDKIGREDSEKLITMSFGRRRTLISIMKYIHIFNPKTARGMQLMLHPPLLQAHTTSVVLGDYEHPLVSPQLMHLRQVPFRTSVNCLQFWQGSPS